MKIRTVIIVLAALTFLMASFTLANGAAPGVKKTASVYNAEAKCQMVCKAPKPALAVLEDGLAYLLDIPLAILSPISCPLASPIINKLDPVEKRSFARSRLRK